MRKLDLAALRADGTRGRVDAVVGAAARMRADTAHALFRYCHVSLSPSSGCVFAAAHLQHKHAKCNVSKADFPTQGSIPLFQNLRTEPELAGPRAAVSGALSSAWDSAASLQGRGRLASARGTKDAKL